MARIIVLDSGPLGLACDNPKKPDVIAITSWYLTAWANGALLIIPEIADYEVRRNLILEKRSPSIERLDRLRDRFPYLPINTEAMRKAADLWAGVRLRGAQTADDKALDADVILASQALCFAGLNDHLAVATENSRHFSRFHDLSGHPIIARNWRDMRP